MDKKKLVLALFSRAGLGVALAVSALTVNAAPIINNASFEVPAQSPGGYAYNPGGADWTFTDNAGVAFQGPWFSDPAPNGVQAAFLQASSGQPDQGSNTIYQVISGFDIGNLYTFSFFMAQRPGYALNNFNVFLDATLIGTYSPASTTFTQVSTDSIVATATSMTLKFQALNSGNFGDADTIIDMVEAQDLGAVPEPGSLATVALGLTAGIALLRRRKA